MKQTGRFGEFGGVYAPQILIPALEQLEEAFLDAQSDASFHRSLSRSFGTMRAAPHPCIAAANLAATVV